MSPAELFPIVNVAPLPIWLVWIAAPRSAIARRLAASLWPWAVLGALYAGTLLAGLAWEPAVERASFFSLAGVMALFDSEWGTLAGWIHYLAFDLFVGRWILLDAPEAGAKLAPVLALTLMFGPLGLLLYIALRSRLRGAAAP